MGASLHTCILRCTANGSPPLIRTQNLLRGLLLTQRIDSDLYVSHHAAGADLWRYSLNFGTSYSNWTTYSGGKNTLAPRAWSGTSAQEWSGEHIIAQYWSRLSGSSSHYQHGDLDWKTPRRFPNLWIEGAFNQYGYDAGLSNQMELHANATWSINFLAEWPALVSFNAWGINPDGQPDVTQVSSRGHTQFLKQVTIDDRILRHLLTYFVRWCRYLVTLTEVRNLPCFSLIGH